MFVQLGLSSCFRQQIRLHIKVSQQGSKWFTFLSQIFIHDQFSVPQVVQDGAEVRGVPVDQVGSRLVLREHKS